MKKTIALMMTIFMLAGMFQGALAEEQPLPSPGEQGAVIVSYEDEDSTPGELSEENNISEEPDAAEEAGEKAEDGEQQPAELNEEFLVVRDHMRDQEYEGCEREIRTEAVNEGAVDILKPSLSFKQGENLGIHPQYDKYINSVPCHSYK